MRPAEVWSCSSKQTSDFKSAAPWLYIFTYMYTVRYDIVYPLIHINIFILHVCISRNIINENMNFVTAQNTQFYIKFKIILL